MMESRFGRSIDRISELPDFILCHILSFLPTKYSVRTSILSTRWKCLWASVPNMYFENSLLFLHWSELGEDRITGYLSFMNFLKKSLLSDVICFQKFHLNIVNCGSNIDLVNQWISAAIWRNVKEFKLFCGLNFDFILPHQLFTCGNLVSLMLKGRFLLHVPDSVWLPSLKVLSLQNIQYSNYDSVQKLFSGCPILEELFIERHIVVDLPVLQITVPTLKNLTVRHINDLSVPGDELNEPSSFDRGFSSLLKVLVNCPRLEYFSLQDFVTENFLLEIQPSFSKAFIDFGHVCPNATKFDSYGILISKLLCRIANVKLLTLTSSTISFLSTFNDCGLPTFHSLNHLVLGADGGMGWNMLTYFLQCSPQLEVLILEKKVHEIVYKGKWVLDLTQCWTPPLLVPICLLLHLKEIDIREFNGERYEIEAIQYLLKNCKVLKKMTIDCRSLDKKEGLPVRNKLTKFSRDSMACELNILY